MQTAAIDHDAFRKLLDDEDSGMPLPTSPPAFKEPQEWPDEWQDTADYPAPAIEPENGPSNPATEPTTDDGMNLSSDPSRITCETAVNRNGGRTTTHVRLPIALAARLERLAAEMRRAHVEGRIILPSAHADRPPVWLVIERALDEVEARRARSARPRRKQS